MGAPEVDVLKVTAQTGIAVVVTACKLETAFISRSGEESYLVELK